MGTRIGTVLATPIGGLGVEVVDGAVTGVSFGATDEAMPAADPARAEPIRADPVLVAAVTELREYFAGDRLEFTVPTVLRRGSEFERAVWAQIAAVPYGETVTYGAIAHALGEPGAAQAVGLACSRNPLPVLIPCHRVVGAGNKLVGFGGGLPRKRWLLQLEARVSIERAFGEDG
jgi:methylated-DNA-[protein]-cysteine S-methyltransferase